MNAQQALRMLGVGENTLTPAEKEKLDTDGYLLLLNILSLEQVAILGKRLEELVNVRNEDFAGNGTNNLINKDPRFDICFTHPRILAGVTYILGSDFKLSAFDGHSPKTGQGTQVLHPDCELPSRMNQYRACNTVWLLDDFTPENGPTRVVPGSHRFNKMPNDEMKDLLAPHPQELYSARMSLDVVIMYK